MSKKVKALNKDEISKALIDQVVRNVVQIDQLAQQKNKIINALKRVDDDLTGLRTSNGQFMENISLVTGKSVEDVQKEINVILNPEPPQEEIKDGHITRLRPQHWPNVQQPERCISTIGDIMLMATCIIRENLFIQKLLLNKDLFFFLV